MFRPKCTCSSSNLDWRIKNLVLKKLVYSNQCSMFLTSFTMFELIILIITLSGVGENVSIWICTPASIFFQLFVRVVNVTGSIGWANCTDKTAAFRCFSICSLCKICELNWDLCWGLSGGATRPISNGSYSTSCCSPWPKKLFPHEEPVPPPGLIPGWLAEAKLALVSRRVNAINENNREIMTLCCFRESVIIFFVKMATSILFYVVNSATRAISGSTWV